MTIPPDFAATPEEIRDALKRPQITLGVLRGVQRHLRELNFESLSEVPLRNGRRADVMAIGPQGEIWIIEIKSSISDFKSDLKWPEYADFCDALFFAAPLDFPHEILPGGCGLILADAFGAEVVRIVPGTKLPAARRKAVTLAFARSAAARLHGTFDPPA